MGGKRHLLRLVIVLGLVVAVAAGCQSTATSTATPSHGPSPTVSMPTVITPPTDINEAVVDCGVGQVGADLNKMEPVHFVLANPDDLFQACEIADLVDAPTKGGGPLQVLTAAPDVLGRLSFIFEDGVCWDRVLRVTPTPDSTPIPAYTFITGPTLPAGHWFDLSVETVFTNEDPCPAIGVSRSARIRLAGWPEIPIETSKATPTSVGPGST